MTDDPRNSYRPTDPTDEQWTRAALSVCRDPARAVQCPVCRAEAVDAEWNLVSVMSRDADIDLKCEACSAAVNLRIRLPSHAPDFYPLARMVSISPSVVKEVAQILERIGQHERLLPAATWMIHPLWLVAAWSATTFRWHPTSDAPPIMGLVFENAEAAKRLFRSWTDQHGHTDELEEIRTSIIEGDVPGQDPGYSVHICPDPDNSLVRATAEGVVIDTVPLKLLGQMRRMHPIAGSPPLLPRFKHEFETHQEFLLAPVTRRDDGQLYVDVDCGIIKNAIHFRSVADIADGDIDEVVLRSPNLILPIEPPGSAFDSS